MRGNAKRCASFHRGRCGIVRLADPPGLDRLAVGIGQAIGTTERLGGAGYINKIHLSSLAESKGPRQYWSLALRLLGNMKKINRSKVLPERIGHPLAMAPPGMSVPATGEDAEREG